MKYVSLEDFIKLSEHELIVDVRTPLEFEQGHIIRAINIPIFTNEERVLIGTCYKQQGRKPAILLGYELIGSRWAYYIRQVETLLSERNHSTKKVFIHCWRGGMRSASMAWALSMYGFDVHILKGGYKTYRRFYLETLTKQLPIIILSGKTGCAKTATLHEMEKLGEQILDLEKIANHQGSSFGSKGNDYQPSQEHFENIIAHELSNFDSTKRIWIENESIVIGKRVLPPILFQQMRTTPIIDMQLPLQDRIDFLDQDYGSLPAEFLKNSVLKISKRLGPNETKLTLQAIDEGRMKDFIAMALSYYDKTYERSQLKRVPSTIHTLELDSLDPIMNATHIIAFCNEKFGNSITEFLPSLDLVQQDESSTQTMNISQA